MISLSLTVRRRRPSLRTAAPAAGVVVGALAVWEILGRSSVVPSGSLPSVTAIGRALGPELTTGQFWDSMGSTVAQWLVGLAIACVVAVPLGLVIGLSDVVYDWTRSTIDFLRAVPPIVLLPLFVLVFGSQLKMVGLLVLYGAAWPLLVQTVDGVRQINSATLETARSFHVGWIRTFFKVILPAASAFTLNGLRTAAVLAIFVTFACELIAGSPGIGRTIAQAQVGGDIALMYGLTAVAGILGWLINTVFASLERRLTPWSPTQQREARK